MTAAQRPIRVVQFLHCFGIGGTESQAISLWGALRPGYDLKVALIEDDGPLRVGMEQLGLSPVLFPLGESARRPNTLRQIAAAARWFEQERIELVHAHDFYAGLVAIPAARLATIPVVLGRLDLLHWQTASQRVTLRWLTRLATHVVANAEAIRRALLASESLAPSRVSVVRNGLDLSAFDASLRRGPTAPVPEVGDAPLVLHVANMAHPVKRQEDLLVALTLARRRQPELQAFLVGDGPRRAGLQRLAGRLGLAKAVHFLGFRSDVPALYGRASVGVLCSSSEGLSNAVIEGMAAARPMVVTDVGGNPELVTDGENGRVVPVGSPDALAAALIDVLSDPARARRMGEAGRERVARDLSLSRLAAEHDALYRRLVGREAQPRRVSTPLDRSARRSGRALRPGWSRREERR